MNYTDCMVDLETMSTKTNAAILTIGAVKFDPAGEMKPLAEKETYYRKIDLQSCVNIGLHVDPATQKWWNSQGDIAKEEVMGTVDDRITIRKALLELNDFFFGCTYMWAQGIDFDCVILREAYTRLGITPPWKFWNSRDSRTVNDLAGISRKNAPLGVGKHSVHVFNNESCRCKKSDIVPLIVHNSLHDCYSQVYCLKLGLRNIKIK